MMIKRSAFLTATFLTPFAIHAMELATTPIPQTIAARRKSVNAICWQTGNMLKEFQPDNRISAKFLVNIIEQTNCLKQANITEKEIGIYLITQQANPSFGDQINAFLRGNTVTKFHGALFFERLASYNQRLATENQTSPNFTEILTHWKNQRLNKIATNSASFGITITESTLIEKRIPIPASVAVTAFDQLMLHIAKMLQESAKDIKTTAKLAYHNELKPQSASVVLTNQNPTETNQ